MIPDRDWQAAYRDAVAEGRKRLGEPPTEAEFASWLSGDLSEARSERIEEFLACYPELARALAWREPATEEGLIGDDDYLSEADLRRDHELILSRLAPFAARPSRTLLAVAAVAVVAFVVVCCLYVQSKADADRFRLELTHRQLEIERFVLLPNGERSGEASAIDLASQADYLLLAPALINQPSFPRYQVDIADPRSTTLQPIWSVTGLTKRDDQTVEIVVPRTLLAQGTYRITVSGIVPTGTRPLAVYSVHIPRVAGTP